MPLRRVVVLGAFLAGIGACGGSSDPSAASGAPGSTATGSGGTAGISIDFDGSASGTGGAGGEFSGNVPSLKDAMVQPCPTASGYAGDDRCIQAPDPSEGFQLHYGPADYADDAQVAPYLLGPGEEKTDCFFLKTPNTGSVYLNEFHGRMRPGAHHILVYALGKDHPDGLDSACTTASDARLLVSSQLPSVDFPTTNAPENQGLAIKLEPGTQVAIELHYINSSPAASILREAWINFAYADPAQVKTLTDPIFFVGGLDMKIGPYATRRIQGTCTATQDLRILYMAGHYHSHTTRFTAWKVSAGGHQTLINESYQWQDVYPTYFDSVTMNPTPNPATADPGGFSGDLDIAQGESVQWECEVVNDTAATLSYGNDFRTAEMCNLYGAYAPSFGRPWACFVQ